MDLREWFDNNHIEYSGVPINGALLTKKYLEPLNESSNRTFSSRNARFYAHQIRNMLKIEKFASSRDLPDKIDRCIVFAVNFSPKDYRHFSHVLPLVEKAETPLIFTVREDVFRYFRSRNYPVCMFYLKERLKEMKKFSFRDTAYELLDATEKATLLKSASLVRLLEKFSDCFSFPRCIVTLQDFHPFDHVFASFFNSRKIPTVTLQHGKLQLGGLWQFVFSNYIICWGDISANILQQNGIPKQKIVPLGTAKYDDLEEMIFQNEGKDRFTVQIGIQQESVLGNDYGMKTHAWIRSFIEENSDYNYILKFHPSKATSEINKYKSMAQNKNVTISRANNPNKIICESDVVLTYRSGLALDAMVLQRPVIEYLEEHGNNPKQIFGDYRDIVLKVNTAKDLYQVLNRLKTDKGFKQKTLNAQNDYIRSELKRPPCAEKILEFIYTISNSKRT